MTQELLIAKKYAQAFLNVFFSSLSDTDMNRVQKAIDFFATHRQLLALLKVPHIDSQEKMRALEQVLIVTYELPPVFKQLIAVVVQQKRAFYILEILKYLKEIYQHCKHIQVFQIRSSNTLEQAELDVLQKFLARKTGQIIFYTQRLDPSLIAGIRMQSDQLLWEYSIKKQLAGMSQS